MRIIQKEKPMPIYKIFERFFRKIYGTSGCRNSLGTYSLNGEIRIEVASFGNTYDINPVVEIHGETGKYCCIEIRIEDENISFDSVDDSQDNLYCKLNLLEERLIKSGYLPDSILQVTIIRPPEIERGKNV